MAMNSLELSDAEVACRKRLGRALAGDLFLEGFQAALVADAELVDENRGAFVAVGVVDGFVHAVSASAGALS